MAEALLKFNTENKEDLMALNRALKSLDMTIVLFEIVNNLRRKLEYDESNDFNTIEKTFDAIYQLVDEYNLILDDLIE